MRIVFFFLAFVGLDSCFGLRILLFGDSVDRQTVSSWCENELGRNATEWGSRHLNYRKKGSGRQATLTCANSDGIHRISFVHVFGSNETGPYLNFLGGGLEDTKPRMTHSLDEYITHFQSPPDRVYLHFSRWDVQQLQRLGLARDSTSVEEISSQTLLVDSFCSNLEARIDDVYSYFVARGQGQGNGSAAGNRNGNGDWNDSMYNNSNAHAHAHAHNVLLGLRTGAWSSSGGTILKHFNDCTRQISQKRNLILFDFDKDIWSTVAFDTTKESLLFRDWIHPRVHYSITKGDKMLERQFTNYLLRENLLSRHRYRNSFYSYITAPHSNYSQLVVPLIQINDSLFLFNNERSFLHKIYNKTRFLDSQNALRLGTSDVFVATAEEGGQISSKIPQGKPFPVQLFQESVIFNISNKNSKESDLFVLHASSLRRLPSQQTLLFFDSDASNVVQVTDGEEDNDMRFWTTKCIPMGGDLPLVFSNPLGENEMLLRHFKERHVYYVVNATRRPWNSLAIKPNIDLERAVVVLSHDDVEVFKLV